MMMVIDNYNKKKLIKTNSTIKSFIIKKYLLACLKKKRDLQELVRSVNQSKDRLFPKTLKPLKLRS